MYSVLTFQSPCASLKAAGLIKSLNARSLDGVSFSLSFSQKHPFDSYEQISNLKAHHSHFMLMQIRANSSFCRKAESGRARHLCVHGVLPVIADLRSTRVFLYSIRDAVQHFTVGIAIALFLAHINLLTSGVAFVSSTHVC